MPFASSDPGFRLGIDLGGTKIEGIVLDKEGHDLFRKRVPTGQERGYAHILDTIRSLHSEMVQRIGGADHTLGIGTPGAISRKTGLLKNSNTQCLNGQPLREDLRKVLGRDFEIQNDANCFALAEARLGAVAGNELVFGIIMGTGCGGGIVYRGDVLTGLHAITGEWGHTSIDPNGPQCWCGSMGCVETLISGSGLERLYLESTGQKLPLQAIVEFFRGGEKDAASFMRRFFRNFGRALANVINLLDPDIIVLGGGLSNIPELYTDGVAQVHRFVFSDGCDTPIVKNQLGDSAGVIGAAFIGI